MMSLEDLKKKLIKLGIVVKKKKKIPLKGGIISDIYFDVKKAYGYPEIRKILAEEIYKKFSSDITCIAATGCGGVPLATEVSSKYGLKLSIVRTELKGYGLNKMIECYVPKKDDIVTIVDDVVTEGTSINEVIKTLNPKTTIEGCYVIIRRNDATIQPPLKYYKLDYLFEGNSLL